MDFIVKANVVDRMLWAYFIFFFLCLSFNVYAKLALYLQKQVEVGIELAAICSLQIAFRKPHNIIFLQNTNSF